ncbi:type IV secretion system protein [Escherichia coli]|uniref:type IV secretion system protein n=1 Tax=Escherichia coli TaxID=562 RepID=UPI003CC8C0B8
MGGWLDSATQAIDGLKETFAGGDPWKWVDELWGESSAGSCISYVQRYFEVCENRWGNRIFITYAGGIIALLLTSIVYLAAEVTIKILTITAPLFIICLSFGFLRQCLIAGFS